MDKRLPDADEEGQEFYLAALDEELTVLDREIEDLVHLRCRVVEVREAFLERWSVAPVASRVIDPPAQQAKTQAAETTSPATQGQGCGAAGRAGEKGRDVAATIREWIDTMCRELSLSRPNRGQYPDTEKPQPD